MKTFTHSIKRETDNNLNDGGEAEDDAAEEAAPIAEEAVSFRLCFDPAVKEELVGQLTKAAVVDDEAEVDGETAAENVAEEEAVQTAAENSTENETE